VIRIVPEIAQLFPFLVLHQLLDLLPAGGALKALRLCAPVQKNSNTTRFLLDNL
jgi:hypothetical protein